MARASVLVYTLADDVPMGWPMSILEATLCGTIVIAPDRPEVYELLGEHVLVYHDEDEIAEHVRRVAAGGATIEKTRQALRDLAQRHTRPEALRALHDGLRDGLTDLVLAGS